MGGREGELGDLLSGLQCPKKRKASTEWLGGSGPAWIRTQVSYLLCNRASQSLIPFYT